MSARPPRDEGALRGAGPARRDEGALRGAGPPRDEGALRGASPAGDGLAGGAPSARAEPWVLAAAILGSSLAFLDGTIVTVALPVLQVRLGASVSQAQWVVELYTLFLASLVLVGGTLGDRIGRRRVFALGVWVFAAASLGCALALGISTLLLARAIQGIGAALLVPASLALISAAFPEDRRGRAIGTWSGVSAMATAVGPPVGGWLVQHGSWRWAFLLNLPFAAAALLALARVPESRDPEARGFDLAGATLATLGLGALTYGLVESPARGWGDPRVAGALSAGVIALVAFVMVERRVPSPMLPPAVFRSRTFAGANGLTLLLYGALAGAFFFLPFDLIQVQGYSPTAAGATLLPFTVILFLLSRWSGGLVARFGGRGPLVAGPLVTAVGFGLLAVPEVGGTYWTTFFPGIVVLGLGMALTVAPLTTVVMSSIPADHAGLASGINNAVARVAGLLAIAALGVVQVATFRTGLESRLDALDPPREVRLALERQRDRLAAAEVPRTLPGHDREALRGAIQDSFVDGFRLVMVVAGALAVGSAACAWLFVDRDRKASAMAARREPR